MGIGERVGSYEKEGEAGEAAMREGEDSGGSAMRASRGRQTDRDWRIEL